MRKSPRRFKNLPQTHFIILHVYKVTDKSQEAFTPNVIKSAKSKQIMQGLGQLTLRQKTSKRPENQERCGIGFRPYWRI